MKKRNYNLNLEKLKEKEKNYLKIIRKKLRKFII